MNPFTEEQLQQLLKNGSPEYTDQDHPPVVQLTLPGTDFCWMLSELNPEEANIGFGLCDLGFGCPELGYVDLEELKTLKVGIFGFTVYNNRLFKAKFPMSVYAEAARKFGHVVWDEDILARHGEPRPPQLKL